MKNITIKITNKNDTSLRYTYFLEKSSTLIHHLLIGKGTAKQRLRECETLLILVLSQEVPDDLKHIKERIWKNLNKKEGIYFDDEIRMSAFQRTLINMKNEKASAIINDIYTLYSEIKFRKN